jgi:hypothetical protein
MALRYPHLSWFNSGATLVNEIVYPFPCIVWEIHIVHTGTSPEYIQIFDAASAPADGSVPREVHYTGQKESLDLDVNRPHYFANGFYLCESSTAATKTLDVATDLFVAIALEDPEPVE